MIDSRSRLWLGALLVIIAAALMRCYLTSRTPKPTVLGWHIDDRKLVMEVSLLNRSRSALVYSHHPFPVRFRTGGGWTNAQIENAFRCAALDPGQSLAVKVIVEVPQELPKAFQVGTDFASHYLPPQWLCRLSASTGGRFLARIIDPMMRSLEKTRPVSCRWSDEVTLGEHNGAKPERLSDAP